MAKPSILKGTRDFGPSTMIKRNFILNTIRNVFESHGFLPIETPAMERLETLTGKYGEEGDQLIFKILNNGNFLSKADEIALHERDSKKLSFSISKKALRYDLTVPFARFVVLNQNDIAFPFKRYQIQPVWRGDRPGKGRYQEFYQCDVDIIGSNGLLNEVELVQIFDEALSRLKIPGFEIKINNRKVLAGIAEVIGASEQFNEMCIAIDKLDKIGIDRVNEELVGRGISMKQCEALAPVFSFSGSNSEILTFLGEYLSSSEIGLKGIKELKSILDICSNLNINEPKFKLDAVLARGLNYYTGAIFEVVVPDSGIGSICGGGRYDDLTGIFGLPDISGVGVSFGADRIYDVMEHFKLFPEETMSTSQLMFVNFGDQESLYCLKLMNELREKGLNTELFPTSAKMTKQMKYANQKSIPFVALTGSREMETGVIAVKNMVSGEQHQVKREDLVEFLTC